MTDTFAGFKSSSFYGKSVNDSLFTSLMVNTPRIEQTGAISSNSKKFAQSSDSRKSKKAKTSLFSGVKHGLKKPKPKKIDVKKYINTDTDKVLKLSSKKKQNVQSTKENKPLNQLQKTPNKESNKAMKSSNKKSSNKKSSNKKSNEQNIKNEDKAFRYHFQVTPESLKVAKVLPYSGFSQISTSSKKGKKKLFNLDDDDDENDESDNCATSSKKIKLYNGTPSSHNNKKASPKKMFITENVKSTTTPQKDNHNTQRTPSTRSAKKVVYETIDINETPSPQITTNIFNKLQDSISNTISPRKSPRFSTVTMKSPRVELRRLTPSKYQTREEPMLVDSPQMVKSPVTKKTSTPCSTPMLTRSSQKKISLEQDTPRRTLSSKKKLFPKEDYNRTPGEYFEQDVTADSFNVFDILNDSLDGIEMLDGSCSGMMKGNLFSPKKSFASKKQWSAMWENSPESDPANLSAHYTFPKCKDLEPHNKKPTVNTFPRSTRASRKCVRQLTPNPRMYGSCKKTLKTAFDLSQLQLSSPGSKICPVCAYKGDTDDSEHLQIHSVVLKLKHYDYKNESVVATYPNDLARVVRITSDDQTWLSKANLVIEIADTELGFAESECSLVNKTQVYLYITKQTIVGLAVANPLTQANRLISSTLNHSVDYASEEVYAATCGISRIWVLKTYRRRRIASRLLDSVRKNFIPNKTVSTDQLAFSVPTSDGKFLAAKYTRRKDFLIFTELK